MRPFSFLRFPSCSPLHPAGRRRLLGAALPFLLAGCVVRSSTHKEALSELEQARQRQQVLAARLEDERDRCREREARLREQLEDREEEINRLIDEVGMARRNTLRTEEDLSEARLETQRCRTLLNAQGAEAQRLQARLEQLASIEREIRERNRIYEEVIERFSSLIDAGRLSVSIDRGRMVINLPQDILFPSGSATLNEEGRGTLAEVAGVLGEFEDRRFQVEGHTDDVPISTREFPSNWELSAGRALSVVKLLVGRGVSPENLSGAAFGEYQPVASNETASGRRRNRRIEIVMIPNLDVIADVASVGEESGGPR